MVSMELANSFSNSLFHGKDEEKWGGGNQPKNLDNMKGKSGFLVELISQSLLSIPHIYYLSSVVSCNEVNTVCKIPKIFERLSPSGSRTNLLS